MTDVLPRLRAIARICPTPSILALIRDQEVREAMAAERAAWDRAMNWMQR
jgi:hypothetical protein